MGLFGKSLQSGFGREIGKNTGKIISNLIFEKDSSTSNNNTLEITKEQSEQEAIEEKDADRIKLETEETKLQIERKKQEVQLELEQLKQEDRAQKHGAKIAIEIKKHNKNIVGELKKLKGLLDEEMLTQEEYIILKERLLIYL